MFRTVCYVFSLFITSLIIPHICMSEDYSTWSGSQLIVLNTSPDGANISNNVYNFPILIRLNPETFTYFSQTQPGGTDIRFAKTDGTHLSYEIERWVDNPNNNDTAEIWVKLDTVFGNKSTQSFIMYWGKSNASDSSSPGSVFGTINNYSSTLHFNEDGSSMVFDATNAKNDAVPAGGFNNTISISGAIGIALSFDGVDDYLQINSSLVKTALSTGNKKTTLSCWVKPDVIHSTKVIFFEGEGGGICWEDEEQLHFGFGNDAAGTISDKSLTLFMGDPINNGSSGNPIRATTAYTDINSWHYAAATIDNSSSTSTTAILYLDGIPVDTSVIQGKITLDKWGSNTRIGRQGEDGGYFDGTLDEVRISNTTRSADWLKLCFENQKSNQKLITHSDIPSDAATITTCTFDTASSMIRFGWNIDTFKYSGELDIGIALSLEHYPDNMVNGIIITTPSVQQDTLLRPIQLFPDTLYYVSLFVRKPGGKWNGGTSLMRKSVRTSRFILAEASTMTALSFDSINTAIQVSWHVDTVKYYGQYDIGIALSPDTFPDNMNDGILIDQPPADGKTLLHPQPLLPEKIYFVSMFVRKPYGEWIGGTNSLQRTVRTPASSLSDFTKINHLYFDTIEAAISVGWTIDTLRYGTLFDVGITFSPDTFPVTMSNGTIIEKAQPQGSTLLQAGQAWSDTLLYVSLFVQAPGEAWAGATLPMQGTVRTKSRKKPDATKIDHLYFDSIAAAINIGWKIDTLKYGTLFDVGIAFSPDTFPAAMNNGTIIEKAKPQSNTALQPEQAWSDTLLYVSLFVRVHGEVWTEATLPMQGTVRTGVSLSADAATISVLSFDSLTSSILIGWNIDTSQYNSQLDIGIGYSFKNYPTDMSNGTIIQASPVNGKTIIHIQPSLIDTLCYVSLFIRKAGGAWLKAADSQQRTVYSKSDSDKIADFTDVPLGDTIELFNKQVLLWEDSISSKSIDTLAFFTPAVPKGFTIAGTPFEFVNKNSTTPVSIGIRIGTLPENISINSVRIYNDSNGDIKVYYLSQIDSINKIVYITTTNRQLPFVPMIDTLKPVVEQINSDTSAIYPGKDFVTTVSISDNISNVKWEYLYSSADKPLVVQKKGTLSKERNDLQLTISGSSDVISPQSGLRSLLVVSDGVQSDTINLSRSVYRNTSDLFISDKNVWHQVYATAVLENTNPDSLIIGRSIGENPVYDQRYRRLFRWVETDNNRNNPKKWVEYDPENETTKPYFSMIPGRMFWLKTKERNIISLGSGHTVSLREKFTFTLPPKQFTDFGTPFRFGVSISDILAASGEKTDNIQIYKWNRNASTSHYTCEPVYIKGMSGKQDVSQLISYEHSGTYCLYNPNDYPVELKIPTFPSSNKPFKSLAKKSSASFWGAQFVSSVQNGNALPALYCGYAPGYRNSDYPVAPSFEEMHIYIYDRNLNKQQGHYISEDAALGVAREVTISNTSDSTKVVFYHFETTGTFPETFSSYLFDNSTQRYSTSGSISVKPHSTVSRWLIVGDSQWRDHFVQSIQQYNYRMQPLYPNPARSSITIKYSMGLELQKYILISIFDLHGRRVWEKQFKSSSYLTPGNHTISWNGTNLSDATVGAGMYLVKMSVINTNGTTIRQFHQRFSFIP